MERINYLSSLNGNAGEQAAQEQSNRPGTWSHGDICGDVYRVQTSPPSWDPMNWVFLWEVSSDVFLSSYPLLS